MTREIKPDFERYLKTLHCEEPDRVPLGDWHVDPMVKEAFLGRKIQGVQDFIDFWHQAGFDYLTDSSGILEPVRAPEGMISGREAAQTEYGIREREWAHEHEGIITDWDQFEQYPWPSVDDFDLSKWEIYDKVLPPGMKAVFLLGKIYTTVWMFMGAEVFFDALENNPKLVEAMFEKVGSIQYETFLRVIEHGCVGAVLNPDDIAHNTGLLVHPDHLRKYLYPWYKKMGAVCLDKGIGWIFHSDGDCSAALDDLLDCHFHGFNPIQPNAMDIEVIKEQYRGRLCLIGNLNLDSTLTLGSPQDVRAEVHERIRVCAPGGGYMVASSNSVTDYVPLENMKAMIEATFEFGRYPIALESGAVEGKVWSYLGKGEPEPHPGETISTAGDLDLQPIVSGLLASDVDALSAQVRQALDRGMEINTVIQQGLVNAMTLIGDMFQQNKIYIPEMMLSAKAMAQTLDQFADLIAGYSAQKAGRVVIGTVKGDLHDIGKNIVILMLQGQGFEVVDLGTNVTADDFTARVQEHKPDILALSALLTTTMTEMRSTIDAIDEAGLRTAVKIIVGGAPVTQDFARTIGADGYAYDAPGAARLCRQLLDA